MWTLYDTISAGSRLVANVPLWWDVDSQGDYACMREGSMWKISVSFLSFALNLKLL